MSQGIRAFIVRRAVAVCAAVAFVVAVAEAKGQPSGPAITALSDDFNNAATLANWQNINITESWGAEHLEVHNIDTSTPGHLHLMPYACSWYENYRSSYLYKELQGDFVVTGRVSISNRAGTGAPGSEYSLGGIAVRTPVSRTPATWMPGQENYIFLSHGAASNPGTWQYEDKATDDSVSNLIVTTAGNGEAEIQIARLGQYFILLRREVPSGSWIVHRRFSRTDMTGVIQAGFFTYTDWPTASSVAPFVQNTTVNTGGNPDIIARWDWVRFHFPTLPAPLVGQDLTNSGTVPDAALLAFLGGNAVPVEVSGFVLE